MALQLNAESFRVHLPVLLQAEQSLASDAIRTARLTATCTRLSATHAHLEADHAPAHGDYLQLKIALPRRHELSLFGRITWSISTSAPALLCGTRDRSLGARFELEFAPTSPDLFKLLGLLTTRRSERQARIRRTARRMGIAVAPRRGRHAGA